MQEFWNSVLPFYGIVSADYEEFDESISMLARTEIVTNRFKDKLLDFHKLNYVDKASPDIVPLPDDYTIDESRILILWKNAPVTPYFQEVNDHLIYSFCKKYFSETYTGFNYRLYIDDFNTLAEGNIALFIKRMHIITQIGNNKPYFMSGNPFVQYTKDLLQYEGLLTDEHKSHLTLDLEINTRNRYLFNHCMEIFENMLSLTHEKPTEAEMENSFVSLYFKWQRGEVTISDCCQALGFTQGDTTKPMSKSAFYRLVELFEKTPIYAQFLNINSDLHNVKRIGQSPAITEFMIDYENTVKSTDDISGLRKICEKYGFVSLSDLNRNYLAIKAKSESKRRKNK